MVYGRFGRYSIATSLLLALLLQPLHQVYADELLDTEAEPASEVADSIAEEEPENGEVDTAEATTEEEDVSVIDPEPAATVATSAVEEDGAEDAAVSSSTAEGVDAVDVLASTATDEETLPTSTSTTSEGVTDGEVSGVATTTASSSEESADTTDTTVTEEAATSSGADTDTMQEETATSGTGQSSVSTSDTPETTASDEELVEAVEQRVAGTSTETMVFESTSDTNRYQFSEQQCVGIGDGSYYCHDMTFANGPATNEEVVYTALSDSGYKDIFLVTSRDTINITNSQYEDTAPHYDSLSGTVVWHRDIGGRYQIMEYNLRTEQTTQLTDTATSNMQPTRSGEQMVWQRWVDGLWQIMLYNSATGVETQLTDSVVHDVAPSIRGNYVMWHTTAENGARQLAVYDTETALISYITDSEGGRVSNPRFILVYDTTFSTGEILTQGYDPETGEVRPLSAVPAEAPPEIPSPDPIGEPRALNQNKTESLEDNLTDTEIEPPEPAESTATATTTVDTATTTVDMTAGSTTVEELTEYDLVIPAATSSTSTQSNNSD